MCATQIVGSVLLKMLRYFQTLRNIFNFPTSEKLQNVDWSMQISF